MASWFGVLLAGLREAVGAFPGVELAEGGDAFAGGADLARGFFGGDVVPGEEHAGSQGFGGGDGVCVAHTTTVAKQ